MLTNTLRHSYTHIHTDIQSYTLIHTRYTCSKQLACTIPSTRYDYFTLLQKPNTVHTVPRTKRHHNNRSQGLWSDYLQLNQTNKFQDPPPTPLKNFGTPHFLLHPPPPSNLNSDWSLTTVCKPFEKKLHLFERLGHPFARTPTRSNDLVTRSLETLGT